jgi:hypothetical protein
MPIKKITKDEIFLFEVKLDGEEFDRMMGALHYWKDDYPAIQSAFDKIQEALNLEWVPQEKL